MDMTSRRARSVCYICMILAAAIWGAAFVAQKMTAEHMGAFTYNGVRFAMGSVALIPVILLLEKPDKSKTRRTWLMGTAGGAVLFTATNLQQVGIILSDSDTAASEAGFITGLYIVLVPIFGLAVGRKAGVMTWIGAVVAFAGLAVISIGPDGVGAIRMTDLTLVLCAVFFAVHILLIDRFVKDINPIRFASIQFATSAVLSTVCALSFENVLNLSSLRGIWAGILPLLFCGILSSSGAYTLQILGQRGVEPSKAAIIMSLEALFAALSEAIWYKVLMEPRVLIGGALIFAAIMLSQIKGKVR